MVVSGLGVAAYHPEGSKFAAYASGAKRASGMCLFSVGGNIGYALGPTATTPLVLALGLTGGLLLALPVLAVALAPAARAAVPRRASPPSRGTGAAATGNDRPGALALLLGVIAFRSVAWFGLITFVPLWEVSLGHSKAHGTHLLSLMLLAGGLGTLAAGPLADRLGRRPVLIASLAATAPLILVYVLVGGIPGAIALAFVGVCVISTFGVTMVMARSTCRGASGWPPGSRSGSRSASAGSPRSASARWPTRSTCRRRCTRRPRRRSSALALAALLPATRPQRRLAPEPVL